VWLLLGFTANGMRERGNLKAGKWNPKNTSCRGTRREMYVKSVKGRWNGKRSFGKAEGGES